MTAVVIVAALLVVAGLVAWFLATRKTPERATSHDFRNRANPTTVQDRPAGPGAENMASDPPGGFTPPGPPDG